MEEWKSDNFSPASAPSSSSQPLSIRSNSDSRQKAEAEADPIVARKVQKADREKLRRDRLNEHFLELGNTLDSERPKNDKATILTDSIQVLKDLAAEVNRLKAEYAALSEESRELMHEKNELREEKASLKSDIETLSGECQQRARVVFPWGPMGSHPPPTAYSYPIPFHSSAQPFPYFGPQNIGPISAPMTSTFVPYIAPLAAERPPPPHPPVAVATQGLKPKPSDREKGDGAVEISDGSNNVATDLELKTPGSSVVEKDLNSSGDRKGEQSHRKEKTITNGSSSSKFSSQLIQDSSSNSVGDVPKT